jgi:hypothetical protein
MQQEKNRFYMMDISRDSIPSQSYNKDFDQILMGLALIFMKWIDTKLWAASEEWQLNQTIWGKKATIGLHFPMCVPCVSFYCHINLKVLKVI